MHAEKIEICARNRSENKINMGVLFLESGVEYKHGKVSTLKGCNLERDGRGKKKIIYLESAR